MASVETRWNVMGAWPPSHMQSLIFARICLHDELGMWPLNLLTKVMYLTSESLGVVDRRKQLVEQVTHHVEARNVEAEELAEAAEASLAVGLDDIPRLEEAELGKAARSDRRY